MGGGGAPVPIGELARRRDIPVQFLEQLFAVLRRAGILRSQRGVKGGYSFARDPGDITVLEVVELLDGPLGGGAESIFAEAAAAARAVLGKATISDVVERENRAAGASMYYIYGWLLPGPVEHGRTGCFALAPYVGPCRITTPGTLIEFKVVNCGLDIATSGVVVRNSLVNGSIDSFDATDSVTVEDSTMDAGPVNGSTNSGARAIMDQHFDLLRVEAIRGVSGGRCNDDCVIRDSWFHVRRIRTRVGRRT